MTFCIGWKTETSSFIIGDSAVTSHDSSNKHAEPESSFQEIQGNLTQDQHISEGAYKVLSEKDVGFALAGDSVFALQLINEIITRLDLGLDIQTSLTHAINNYPDFSSKPQIEILISYFDGQPKLFTLKNKRTQFLQEEDGLAIIGTPLPVLVQAVNEIYFTSTNFWLEHVGLPENDEIFFIKVLAILQGFSSHFHTMADGIGGAYTGLYINNGGVNLQQDICYVITGENPEHDTSKFVSVHVNKHLFCIINSNSAPLLISNTPESSTQQEAEEFYKKSGESFDKGNFKYFIFINTFLHVSTIIDMNFKHEHQLMNIDIRKDKPKTLGFFMSSQLQSCMNDKFESLGKPQVPTVYFFPYIPATDGVTQQIQEKKLRPRNEYTLNADELKYKLIIKNKDGDEIFYGSEDKILPFLKHYRKKSKIWVVDNYDDAVVLEYELEVITYPDNAGKLVDHFESIPPKIRKEDLFLFDVYCNEVGENPIFVTVLAKNQADAEKKLAVKNVKEFGEEVFVINSGKIFYHPAYD